MVSDDTRGLRSGFEGDRRIRPAQFFQLDVGLPQRNFIHIWLPEGVSCGGQSLFFVPGGEASGVWEAGPQGEVTCRRDLGRGLSMESTVAETDLGVYLTIRLTNDSPETLQGVSAPACVQLPAAPDLRDLELERTYWRCQGAWRRFEVTSRPQEGRCLFYSHGEPADLPLVAVASGTGPYAAGLIFQGATSVGGNCQGALGCLHSNVPGSDIAPGDTLERRGFLILHPEGLDGVLEAAEEFHGRG